MTDTLAPHNAHGRVYETETDWHGPIRARMRMHLGNSS